MQKLQDLFEESNITLVELSRLTGICTSTIHRYLKGTVKEVNEKYYNPIFEALNNQIRNNQDVKDHGVVSEKEHTIDVDKLKQQMSQNTFAAKPIQADQIPRIPRKGDIFYIKNPYSTGNEMWGSRPAVCVTNTKTFDSTGTIGVCYLTSKPKHDLPCHVNIRTDRSMSILLCESIYTISKDRIDKYFGHISPEEMNAMENALLVSLDIKHINREKIIEIPATVPDAQLEVLRTENKMLKEFNESLLSIAMK